jgi:hypothetical protein
LLLNALRLRGVPGILANSRYTRKPAKVDALATALGIYLPNISTYALPHDPEADNPSEEVTVNVEIVTDWVDHEEAEMEEESTYISY